MKKKLVSVLLAGVMTVGMLAGCGSSKGESTEKSKDYDLTLYSVMTTDPDFDEWLKNVEDATGLNINVIAAPTDSDTRQQKVTTVLSTGDASIDIIEINDEMTASFKNSGWLEGLNDTVMTEDVRSQFAQGYLKNMITDKDGNIVGVPGYTGYLAFWVNQKIMDEVGITEINTKEDFMKYMEAASGDGRYGYGGSWEKTYAYNEIAQFVNMFGGDYFDWTKAENKEAIQFMKDLVEEKTEYAEGVEGRDDKTKRALANRSEGSFSSGNDAMAFMTRPSVQGCKEADMDLSFAPMPKFDAAVTGLADGTTYVGYGSGGYALYKDSANKELAWEFIRFAVSEEGQEIIAEDGLCIPTIKSLQTSDAAWTEYLPGVDQSAFLFEGNTLSLATYARGVEQETEYQIYSKIKQSMMSALLNQTPANVASSLYNAIKNYIK